MVMSPQVSWLFFEAVRAGLAVKRPYLDPCRSRELREFLPWRILHYYFRAWQKTGVWDARRHGTAPCAVFSLRKRCGVAFACGGEKGWVEQVTGESLIVYPHAGLMMP